MPEITYSSNRIAPSEVSHSLKEFSLKDSFGVRVEIPKNQPTAKYAYIVKNGSKHYFNHPTLPVIDDAWVKANYANEKGEFAPGKSALFTPLTPKASNHKKS